MKKKSTIFNFYSIFKILILKCLQNYWALRKNTLKILRGVNEPKIEKILGDPTAEKIQI